VTKASNNIGTSRQWLSELKNLFEDKGKDPRKLEPESKDPHSTKNRKRISKEVEGKILKVREDSKNVWGKVKVAVVLNRDYGIKINPNTVNNYLRKHKLIDPKISLKNSRAWQAKIARENPGADLVVRYRPPKAIKKWEYFYNWKRPHQALGYLTPIAFHELWKVDKEKAYSIVETYQKYLKKQSLRLASARRIKKKEQIEKLMQFIDVKINEKVGIKKAINSLINCQLCSLA